MAQNTRRRSTETVNPWPERVLRQVMPVRRDVQRRRWNRVVWPYASTFARGSRTVSVAWMRRPAPVSPTMIERSLLPRQSQRTVGGLCLSAENAHPSLPLGERNARYVAEAGAGTDAAAAGAGGPGGGQTGRPAPGPKSPRAGGARGRAPPALG